MITIQNLNIMITFLIFYFIIPIVFLGIEAYADRAKEIKILGPWKYLSYAIVITLIWPIALVYLIVELYRNT